MVLLGGRWLKLETLISLVNVISDAEVSIGFLGLTVDSLPLAIRCNSIQLPCVFSSALCPIAVDLQPPLVQVLGSDRPIGQGPGQLLGLWPSTSLCL